MIKENTIAVAGKVQGFWNSDDRAFEIKRGKTKNDKKYQIFEMSVSRKNEDGTWTNGKGMKVMLWGNHKVDHGDMLGVQGRLQPDNYTNKDGKEVWGNMIVAFEEGIFTPDKWEASNEAPSDSSKPKAEDVW